MSSTILITGSQGFIGSYLCTEFLDHDYNVLGVDNFSKYGKVNRSHDKHENFSFLNLDCTSNDFIENLMKYKFDYIIAGAAMIGGISYFHKFAYDLIASNERIIANTFDLALEQFNNKNLKKILVLSSSMVFENTSSWPTIEFDISKSPPPSSTYGFQKLSCEYFAKGAYEQYGLPYTIVRPFNCIGIGEEKALSDIEITSGNIKLMLSHVVPDLINKCLKGQDPLHILGSGTQIRHYTNGKDIARGIRVALESPKALNEDFNISISTSTSVLELAEMIWNKINPTKPFRFISDPPFEYDVEKRVPSIKKAESILGFKANISLSDSLDEVIDWMKKKQE